VAVRARAWFDRHVADRRQRRLLVAALAAALLALPASAGAKLRAADRAACHPEAKRAAKAKRCVRATIRVRPAAAPALLGSRGLEPAGHHAPLALWF